MNRRLPFILSAASVLIADQLSKIAVLELLGSGEGTDRIVLIPGILRLFVTRNTGGIFGILPGAGWIFLLLTGGIISILVVWALRAGTHPGLTGVIVGGGLGNLTDRIFRGRGGLFEPGSGGVIDFIDFSFWPSFNLADAAISIGVMLLVIRGFLEDPRDRSEPESRRPTG